MPFELFQHPGENTVDVAALVFDPKLAPDHADAGAVTSSSQS